MIDANHGSRDKTASEVFDVTEISIGQALTLVGDVR